MALTGILRLLLTALVASAQVIPQRQETQFDSGKMAECLIIEVLKAYDQGKARDLLRKASKVRKDLARKHMARPECESPALRLTQMCTQRGSQPLDLNVLKYMTCLLDSEIVRYLLYHSTPLAHHASTELIQKSDPGAGEKFKTAIFWPASGDAKRKNLNEIPNLKEVMPFAEQNGPSIKPKDVMESTHRLAGALIDWLLEQKPNSVSHIALFRKANDLYQDPFVSLAVIGELFDQERMVCPSRKTSCPLGNRMKSLFKNDQVDRVGYNYHFWAFLNIALVDDVVSATLFTYGFESVYQKDSGDYSADQVGLEVGYNMHRLLWDDTTRYRLKDKTCDIP